MMRRYGRAFTLIEVLVVVAIIALLIAILIPSLSRARVQAKSVQCESNLKQQGYAALMYAQDNKGVLPGSYTDAIERLPWDTHQPGVPEGTVDPTKPWVTGFRQPMIHAYKMSALAGVFYCPANSIRPWTTKNFFMHEGAHGVSGDSGRIQYWWLANPPQGDQANRFHDTNRLWADGRPVTAPPPTNDGYDDEFMRLIDQRWVIARGDAAAFQLSPAKVAICTDQSRQMTPYGWTFIHGGESLPPGETDTKGITHSWKNTLYGDMHVASVRGYKVIPRWGFISGQNYAGW